MYAEECNCASEIRGVHKKIRNFPVYPNSDTNREQLELPKYSLHLDWIWTKLTEPFNYTYTILYKTIKYNIFILSCDYCRKYFQCRATCGNATHVVCLILGKIFTILVLSSHPTLSIESNHYKALENISIFPRDGQALIKIKVGAWAF